MDGSEIEHSVRRASVLAWRDEATLDAMALIHAASARAMRAVDVRLETIAVADTLTGADAAVRAITQSVMSVEVGSSADAWFKASARALRRIDVRLEALALHFSTPGERPRLPQDQPAGATGWIAPAWLRTPVDAIADTIERAETEIASRAVPIVVRERAKQASARLAREIGERSGAHDRLRMAARSELSRIWLGPAPSDASARPYLTQLLDIVDRTAGQAREIVA